MTVAEVFKQAVKDRPDRKEQPYRVCPIDTLLWEKYNKLGNENTSRIGDIRTTDLVNNPHIQEFLLYGCYVVMGTRYSCFSMKAYSGPTILIASASRGPHPDLIGKSSYAELLLYLYPEEWDTTEWRDLPINKNFVRSPFV